MGWLSDAVDYVGGKAKDIGGNVLDKLDETLDSAWDELDSAFDEIGDAGTSAWNQVSDAGTSAWNQVSDAGTSAWNQVSDAGTSAWEGIADAAGDTGGEIWDGVEAVGGAGGHVVGHGLDVVDDYVLDSVDYISGGTVDLDWDDGNFSADMGIDGVLALGVSLGEDGFSYDQSTVGYAMELWATGDGVGVSGAGGADYARLPYADTHLEVTDDGEIIANGELQGTLPTPVGVLSGEVTGDYHRTDEGWTVGGTFDGDLTTPSGTKVSAEGGASHARSGDTSVTTADLRVGVEYPGGASLGVGVDYDRLADGDTVIESTQLEGWAEGYGMSVSADQRWTSLETPEGSVSESVGNFDYKGLDAESAGMVGGTIAERMGFDRPAALEADDGQPGLFDQAIGYFSGSGDGDDGGALEMLRGFNEDDNDGGIWGTIGGVLSGGDNNDNDNDGGIWGTIGGVLSGGDNNDNDNDGGIWGTIGGVLSGGDNNDNDNDGGIWGTIGGVLSGGDNNDNDNDNDGGIWGTIGGVLSGGDNNDNDNDGGIWGTIGGVLSGGDNNDNDNDGGIWGTIGGVLSGGDNNDNDNDGGIWGTIGGVLSGGDNNDNDGGFWDMVGGVLGTTDSDTSGGSVWDEILGGGIAQEGERMDPPGVVPDGHDQDADPIREDSEPGIGWNQTGPSGTAEPDEDVLGTDGLPGADGHGHLGPQDGIGIDPSDVGDVGGIDADTDLGTEFEPAPLAAAPPVPEPAPLPTPEPAPAPEPTFSEQIDNVSESTSDLMDPFDEPM